MAPRHPWPGSAGAPGFFERWFDRLISAGLGAPALAIATIAIGYFLVLASLALPDGYPDLVAMIGFFLLACGSIILVVVAAVYGFRWALGRK